MGHALNLAHSQANGAVWNPNVYDSPQPKDAPRPGRVGRILPRSRPCTRSPPRSRGTAGSTRRPWTASTTCPPYRTSIPLPVIPGTGGRSAARSWIPPEPGPERQRHRAERRRSLQRLQLVHLGAGQQGQAGPDGSFILNDLTPGARYVIYTTTSWSVRSRCRGRSCCPVPRSTTTAGWRAATRLPTTLRVGDRGRTAGAPVTANITFGRYAGAPTLPDRAVHQHPLRHHARRIDRRGRAGRSRRSGGNLNTDSFENIGGLGSAAISDDGTKIASSILDTDGVEKAAIYQNGVWTRSRRYRDRLRCDQDGSTTANLALDISGTARPWWGKSYATAASAGGPSVQVDGRRRERRCSRSSARSTTCRAPAESTTTDP
jgi:hypothetical protein